MWNPDDILENLTLAEKIRLACGAGLWRTLALPVEEFPSLSVAFALNGVARHDGLAPYLACSDLRSATCFPSAGALGCSFDPDVVRTVGRAAGEEARELDCDLLVVSSASPKRSPLSGSSAHRYSEDPLLSSDLCAAMVEGVQSAGVGALVEGFGIEEYEACRFTVNYVADERTLAEEFVLPSARVASQASPAGFVYSASMLNGAFICQTNALSMHPLFAASGYEGVFLAPWACGANPVECIKNSVFPKFSSNPRLGESVLAAALRSGQLTEDELDGHLASLIRLAGKVSASKSVYMTDAATNHALAVSAARASLVLLRNENRTLPVIDPYCRILLVGEDASGMQSQTAGRGYVNAAFTESLSSAMGEYAGIACEPDWRIAPEKAGEADYVIALVSAPGREGDGRDRTGLSLSPEIDVAISALAARCPRTVVVYSGAGPVLMPWENEVAAIIYDPVSGQGGPAALAEIIFGRACPAGRLAVTFPARSQDSPSWRYEPSDGGDVFLQECLFNDYGYYGMCGKEPLYPFGHGLTYTEFTYSDFEALPTGPAGSVGIAFTVKNTGERDGSELWQVYVSDLKKRVPKPGTALARYGRVQLAPGQEERVTVQLGADDFSHYDPPSGEMRFYSTRVAVGVGRSSGEILHSFEREILADRPFSPHVDPVQIPTYMSPPKGELALPNLEYRALCAVDSCLAVSEPPESFGEFLGTRASQKAVTAFQSWFDGVFVKTGDPNASAALALITGSPHGIVREYAAFMTPQAQSLLMPPGTELQERG